MFDLMAADLRGYAIPIQVKAINGGSWQFSADTFLHVDIVDGEQTIRGRTELLNPDLVCIFVVLKPEQDDFYILCLRDLQDHFHQLQGGTPAEKSTVFALCGNAKPTRCFPR